MGFVGTDIDDEIVDTGVAALVCGEAGGGGEGVAAGIDGGAAGEEGHGLGATAVVLQGAEVGIGAYLVAEGGVVRAGGVVAEVVAEGIEGAIGVGDVRAGMAGVGEDGIADIERGGSIEAID